MKFSVGFVLASSPAAAPFTFQSHAGGRHDVALFSASPVGISESFDAPSVFDRPGFVNIAENAPREIATFDEWTTACGVQRSDGFQLTSDDGMDVSVMTTTDIPANNPVLYVPSEMILSSNGIMQELGRIDAAENMLDNLNASDQLPQFYLMLKILLEYERGEESPWYPWLNSLPRFYSNGASMTPFCYSCLPPLAGRLAMQERVNLINFSQAVKKVPFLSEEIKENPGILKFAFQAAFTRSFPANDGTGDMRIAPMGDMFNHGIDAEVEVGYDAEGNCQVYAIKDVPAGSPLRVSYSDGKSMCSVFFARYGFLDESSPGTFCKIMVPHISSQLEDIGFDFSRMLFYKDGGVAEEVWDVLLYMILGDSNVAERKRFYEAHMAGDYEIKQSMHQKYQAATLAALKDHIDTFLQELDELAAKGNGKDMNEHPRLPLILKHNEFVRETFLAVRARYFQ